MKSIKVAGIIYNVYQQGEKEDNTQPHIENAFTNEVPYKDQKEILKDFLNRENIIYDPNNNTHWFVTKVLKEIDKVNKKRFTKENGWDVQDNSTCFREVDRTINVHKYLDIPTDLRWFFDCESLDKNQKKKIIFIVAGTDYPLEIRKEGNNQTRIRLKNGILEKLNLDKSIANLMIVHKRENTFELTIDERLSGENGDYKEEDFTIMNKDDNDSGKSGNSTSVEFDHNLILYGPPGTGKTYNTVVYAVAIIKGETIDDIQKNYTYDEIKKTYDNYKKEGKIVFTTFHQSYGYEEFIEGIKPVLSGNGSIGYSIEDGVFKDFCNRTASTITFDEAWDKLMGDLDANGEVEITLSNKSTQKLHRAANGALASNKKNGEEYPVTISKQAVQKNWESPSKKDDWYNKKIESIIKKLEEDYGLKKGPVQESENNNKVFIIDEINRGNISKIFGELITLIETTKRLGQPEATTVTLPYSKEEFGVPSNVYILGTMNTADRSIAMMDTALRRRFSFVEMMPDTQVLKNLRVETMTNRHVTLDIPKMLTVINKRIEYLFDREHTIGHAFFTGLKNNASIEKLGEIFKKNVIPLLQEYFFEDYEKIQLVLGDNKKSSDDYKFIIKTEETASSIFNGNPELDAMVSYKINPEAFKHLESYIEIYEKTGASN